MEKYFKQVSVILCLYTVMLMFSEFVSASPSTDLATQTSMPIALERQAQPTTNDHETLVQVSSSIVDQQERQASSKPPTIDIPGVSTPTASSINTIVKQQQVIKSKKIFDNPEIEALGEMLQRLKLQNSVLSTQNFIQTEKYQKELLALQQEKEKLLLQNDLQFEKNRQQLAQIQAEKEKLLLENELQFARQTQFLADLNTLKTRLELESEIYEQEKKKVLAKLEVEQEKLAIQNAIQEEKNKHEELKIQLETAKLNFEMVKLDFERSKRGIESEELMEKIAERDQKEIWESQVNRPKKYLKEPFVNGYLIMSDRKIELDEVILQGTATYVNERIQYYNNKSAEYPIFLVIDVCYGGSIMEGSKILEAMQTSRAPIYVVVKSLAASMAAVITTLAERSYAYPNAILVHHQIWSFAFGNQREMEEELDMIKEWTQRIMQPVADKMGITIEKFVKKMYENNSVGDWYEFANAAVKLKWVNTIIKDIRDTSFTKQPLNMNEEMGEEMVLLSTKRKTRLEEKLDVQGRRYVELPRLSQLDAYYLYNPDNYYR
ncbi:ATP-dependent Clp protease proteolytic subunit [Candidatus Parabeggiatoa sp. HSG14]|nr:ATP-dependent Clp protease proteolytic subunit [Thiotrichales bacterium HSG14]